jgi:outer membrane lipoprotein-sorting protein
MSLSRIKVLAPLALLLTLLLAACGGSTSSPTPAKPSPTPALQADQGAKLLGQAGRAFNSANTLHAILNITINGSGFDGNVNTEVWNKSPDKSRSIIRQSTIAQTPVGEETVSDGKQVWQYDPSHHVVYTGPVSGNNSQNTQNTNQFVLSLVRSIFNGSNATLVSSNATVNGRAAYDVHITQAARSTSAAGVRLSYNGDVYLDRASSLPLRAVLTIQGFGQVTIDFPMLTLNPPLSDALFTFVPPPGVKVEAFPTSSSGDTSSLTLAQAQQQAGYHLLSIPTTQSAYALQSIDALGAPGNQIYTLNYTYGNLKFAISEGKALANLPASGQQVSVRGTTGTLSAAGGITTLSWTEKGVGVQIAGALNNSQALTIAGLLS